MKPEEIDRRLAATPPDSSAARTADSPNAGAAAMAALRGLQQAAQPARSSDEARADRDKQRQLFLEGVRLERQRLARRVDPIILARLEASPSPCGLFLGKTGTGKTSALRWLAAEWRGYFVTSRELASSERRCGLGEGHSPEISRARDARVLYLDDIGAEDPRDLGTLQELLDYRYARSLPMVGTTGLTGAELQVHLGKAYVRRLVDQHVPRRDGSEWPVLLVDLFEAASPRGAHVRLV